MDNKSLTLPVNTKSMQTISNPNVKYQIMAVSTILHSQIIEESQNQTPINENSDLYFFSEEKYINEKPEDFDESRIELLKEIPSLDNIYEFMKALYDCAQFSPECCIICLIYVNRMISFTGISISSTTWRPLILSSLLIAQKVWDDKYLSNADFAFIYPFFVTEEINKLEQKFLELLQYNVTVTQALYAKYYFELRGLISSDKDFGQQLNDDQAEKLEQRSKEISEKEQNKVQKLASTIM